MTLPAPPVEFVRITHASRFRGAASGVGSAADVTFLSRGLLRGKYCEVVSKTPLLVDMMLPLTQLREKFGAVAGTNAYTIFDYVPDAVVVAASADPVVKATAPVKKGWEPDNFTGIDVLGRGRAFGL